MKSNMTGKCLTTCLIYIIFNILKLSEASPGYRLPDTIKPVHYIVDIITNLEENNFNFFGKVWIKVRCKI